MIAKEPRSSEMRLFLLNSTPETEKPMVRAIFECIENEDYELLLTFKDYRDFTYIYEQYTGESIPSENVLLDEKESQKNVKRYELPSGIQMIDWIKECFNYNEFCGAMKFNVIKYLIRYKAKNGVEDLDKAKNYIDYLIEFEKDNEKSV